MTDDDFMVGIRNYAGLSIMHLLWARETREFKACKRAYEQYSARTSTAFLDSTWIWKSRIQSLHEGGVGSHDSPERQRAIRQAEREYEARVREQDAELRARRDATESLNNCVKALAARLDQYEP